MVRPRLFSDDTILAATRQLLAELGPAKLTLAAVGARVGLAPPTLMQRFGSKRGLLLASAARSPQLVLLAAAEAEARNSSPLAALRDFALSGAADFDLVHLDVADPEFRTHAQAHSAAIVDSCARILTAAQRADELKPDADVPALARLTLVCFTGAVQVWAVTGRDSLTGFLRDQLDLLLSPYLTEQDEASAL